MKKYILLFFSGLFFSSVYCQTHKGEFIVGGSLGLEKYRLYMPPLSDRIYTTLSVAPDIGYFMFTNIAIGMRPQFSYHRAKIDNIFRSYTIVISPFIRSYVLPPSKRINVFADCSVFVSSTRSKTDTQIATNKFYGYTAMAGPVFFVNDRVALEFTVEYWREFDQPSRYATSDEIKTKVGLQVHLGAIRNRD